MEQPEVQQTNCQNTIEPIDNTSNQMELSPSNSNTENVDINVMETIQTGGGSAPVPPNNLTRENIIKISGKMKIILFLK